MNTAVDRIVSEALALPPNVRALVAEKLIESLDSAADCDLSPAWRKEIQRRCQEIDEATAELIDADAAFARAYAALA
jgi:putative addiction module component (TIGR02574 family)